MSSGGSGVGSCPTDWSSTGLVGTNTCCPGDRLCNACRPGLKKKKKTISSSGPPKISFESMDVRPGWGSLDDNEHGGMGAGGDGAPSLFICEETAPRWSCHDD